MARQSNGFTLLELMIVMGILGIVAGIAVQNGASATEESRATACEKNRTVLEEQEALFVLREGRHTEALDELVEQQYVSRATCPRGGILAWEITDPTDPAYRTSLLCSVHGAKRRIVTGKPTTGDGASTGGTTPPDDGTTTDGGTTGGGGTGTGTDSGDPTDDGTEAPTPSGPTPLGAGFEDGELGSWDALGNVAVVGAEFASLFAGDAAAYIDTNGRRDKVESMGKVASFLKVKKDLLEGLSRRDLDGGSAMKLEVEEGSLDGLRINFLTEDSTSYSRNDVAFLTISNKETKTQQVYKLADTYSYLQRSGTDFRYETGWISLADLGLDITIQKGDIVGIGVLSSSDKSHSALLVDE